MTKINELKFELLSQLSYSSHLAPSDYYLFPTLKTWLDGKKFKSNEEINAINEYFEEIDESYYTPPSYDN